MSGLIKDFALTALVIILNHWIYGIEDNIAYAFIVDHIVKYKVIFLSTGILGSAFLLLSASVFESLGLYKITYGLSKILARVSQFLITFLAILNIVFYAALGNNLIRDRGYLLLFPVALILGGASWALSLIDFNHPTRNMVVPVSALALLSIILVQFVWPLYSP